MQLDLLYTILALITGFVISVKAIPIIIKDSKYRKLADYPDGVRKLHSDSIPRLGGVAIFAGFLISYGIWAGFYLPEFLPAVVASLTILFFVGVKDDINGITPKKKIAGQILAAGIVVFIGGIKIPGLDGLSGITTFPFYTGELFSIFTIIIIINAFNLIDGIDGLAGTISMLASSVFGAWFLAGGHYPEAILSFSLVGALAGFLRFNFQPAKIFMGDTGSQVLGFILAISGFRLMQLNPTTPGFMLAAPSVFVFSVMIIPMFDTFRVIVLRIGRGVSPFKADCNHVHHCLMWMGLSHAKITLYLVLFNIVIILTGLLVNSWNVHLYFVVVSMMPAFILPVFRGLRMLNRISLRISVKPGVQVSPEAGIETHILERSVSERKARDRQIIAEERRRINVKLLNQENGYARSKRRL